MTSVGGFSSGVSLSVTGLPAGATGTFSPSAVAPTGTSTLTVSTTGATPNGTYSLTISGTGSGLTRQTTVTLAVLPAEIGAPTKLSSSIALLVSPTEFNVGNDIIIKGSVSPVREGVVATIEYLSGGGSWNTLATVITSMDGSFTYIWKPSKEGTYLVRANWEGDGTTLSSQSQSVTLQATAPGQAFPLWVLGAVTIGILVVTGAAVIVYNSRRRGKSSNNSAVFRSAR